MGTPEFAVASLKTLLDAGHNVVAVVTAPDKPSGRGQKMSQSAVKQYALSRGLPVMQPEKLKNERFLAELASYRVDLQVVVAFRMLPQVVWNMPPKGTINLHASLLPQYRGAAPINHAIINGEKESGVTTFLLQQEIDTGHILYAEKVAIGPKDNAGDLHDKLMQVGAVLLLKTVNALATGNPMGKPQAHLLGVEELRHAPKIYKEDCRIRWDQPVEQVYNLVRGLSPYPTAFTSFQQKKLKLFKVSMENATVNELPGTYLSDGKHYLKFAANDGYILVEELQLEGKKKMDVEEFLRGVRL